MLCELFARLSLSLAALFSPSVAVRFRHLSPQPHPTQKGQEGQSPRRRDNTT